MTNYSNLGKYLKEQRIGCGLTQMEVAEALGYASSQFVSNWERGLSGPPEKDIPKLVSMLKLDRNTLVELMVRDSQVEIEERIYASKRIKKK